MTFLSRPEIAAGEIAWIWAFVKARRSCKLKATTCVLEKLAIWLVVKDAI